MLAKSKKKTSNSIRFQKVSEARDDVLILLTAEYYSIRLTCLMSDILITDNKHLYYQKPRNKPLSLSIIGLKRLVSTLPVPIHKLISKSIHMIFNQNSNKTIHWLKKKEILYFIRKAPKIFSFLTMFCPPPTYQLIIDLFSVEQKQNKILCESIKYLNLLLTFWSAIFSSSLFSANAIVRLFFSSCSLAASNTSFTSSYKKF